MNKYLTYLLILVAALASVGCNSEADAASASSVTPLSAEGDQSKGDNVKTDAPVINDPGKAPSSGGYKIEPADKNDPRFKPDPRLGGGG